MSAPLSRSALVEGMQKIFDSSFPAKVNFKALAVHADLSTEAEMAVTEDVMNPQQAVHGGALMTFLDTLPAIGAVAASLADGKVPAFSTSEMTTYFLDKAPLGTTVRGRGTVVRWGGKSAVWELHAYAQDGTLVAKAIQTLRFKDFIDTSKLAELAD